MDTKLSRRTALAATAGAAMAFTQPQNGNGSSSQAVSKWIRDTAVRLSTTSAGHGFDDMALLRKFVGDARIVALGEASHGTREFFQLKHRMLEFLVTQAGFSILAIESNMPEAYRLNDFVLKGEGDPAKLLKGLHHLYDTREVLDMVLWMRALNQSGRGRVLFTGFDMQDPRLALETVRDYVAENDAAYAPTLARAREMALRLNPSSPDPAVVVAWENVVKHLEALRPQTGIEWAIQNARIVEQCVRMASSLRKPEVAGPLRDANMAANVKWILDQSPGAKAVIWAHNFHVMTAPDPMGGESMGTKLRKMFGRQLVTFGFAFQQGSFRAQSMDRGAQDFTVGPLPEGSWDTMLATSGIPVFGLDLRAAPKDGPVAEWLSVKRPTRNIMASFAKDAPGYTIFEQVATEAYDCVFFVDRTSAARANPRVPG